MKQILQNLGSGETLLADVPMPRCGGGSLLVESSRSLVSLGTEKMLIDFGKGGLIAKARSQPDKVKQVLQKIKTDGLWTTVDAVKAKLDTPIPLGYCNVGRVVESCKNGRYRPGDRIASNGFHAEFVSVGENLTAPIPDAVDDESAAFTVVAAIGLQGIRLIQPTLGERIVVSGLGLIGLLAVQMLRASGCQVLGIDFDPKKLELARQFGAETCDLSAGQDPVQVAEQWTGGIGVDGVLITASTKSDELIHQAATMCRQRGRIVLVGVIGLNLQRADFYEKELSFQVSCSYGPGRYDPSYEKRGLDYPIGFVRWTEQRNFEAVLQLMAEGKINVAPLITHRFSFDDALQGYAAIDEPGAMGILLAYGGQSCELRAASDEEENEGGELRAASDEEENEDAGCKSLAARKIESSDRSDPNSPSLGEGRRRGTSLRGGPAADAGLVDDRNENPPRVVVPPPRPSQREGEKEGREHGATGGVIVVPPSRSCQGESEKEVHELVGLGRKVGVGFIGAGGFSTRMLMPLLPSPNVTLAAVTSGSGVSAAHAARKFGFATAHGSAEDLLEDPAVDAVFITTPHHLHAKMVCDALGRGKHVFVEKPLGLTHEQIDEVERTLEAHPDRCLMIGFNRRFSPHAVSLKKWMASAPSNKAIVMTVNAGAIPAEHWTQDPAVGGGRIVGEGCHFVDLARFLIGQRIESAAAFPVRDGDGRLRDCVLLQLTFTDGSTAAIHYLANGHKSFPKERIEVFAGGKVYVCENFRTSREIGGRHKLSTRKQDKGHQAELAAFVDALKNGGPWPIPREELLEVSRVTVDLAEMAR